MSQRCIPPGVHPKQLDNAIAFFVDSVPLREIPGTGKTPWPVITHEQAAGILEVFREALKLEPVEYYGALHRAWQRRRRQHRGSSI